MKGKDKNSTITAQAGKKTPEQVRAQRIANLIPGANKNGRPVGKRNKETLFNLAMEAYTQKLLDDYNKTHKKKLTMEEFEEDPERDIFMRLIDKARSGHVKSMEIFLDHRHNKATQPIEVGGQNGDPIEYELKLNSATEKALKMLGKWIPPKEAKKRD